MGAYDDLVPSGAGAYADLVPAVGDRPIDLARPVITNPDGSISTERTITAEIDGKHRLIPTIVGGRQLTAEQAIADHVAGRNPHVGEYDNAIAAEAAAVARSRRIGQARGVDSSPSSQATDVPRETSDISHGETGLVGRIRQFLTPSRARPPLQPTDATAFESDSPGPAPVAASRLDQRRSLSRVRSAGVPNPADAALSGVETAARIVPQAAGALGGGLGAVAAATVSALRGDRATPAGDRLKEGIAEGAARLTPEPVFRNTPQLEEAFGHVIEAARDHIGFSARAAEEARGAIAQGIMPKWLGEYVQSRPDAAEALARAGFDFSMIAAPAFQALGMAGKAASITRMRRAAEDENRFANARDVTPEPAPPGTPQLAAPDTTVRTMRPSADNLPVPKDLPEDHARYFTEGGTAVDINKLKPAATTTEESRLSAAQRMQQASAGEIEKRGPLQVEANGDGTYTVIDGKATLAAAKQYGWQSIPVMEVPAADVPMQKTGGGMADAYDGFKDITGKYPWEMPFEQFYKHTISRVKNAMPGKQPQWYQNLLRTEWTKAKQAGEAMGMTGGDPQMGAVTPELRQQVAQHIELAKTQAPKFAVTMHNMAKELGGAAIVANVKGIDRAAEKAAIDYAGDHTQLKDLLRGTIVLNFPADIARARESRIAAHAQIIKSRDLYATGSGDGYKDAMNVYSLGPIAAEMQFNTPEMIGAKEHGHKLYEAIESIRRQANGNGLTAEQARIVDAARARMREIYSAAEAANVAREKSGQRLSPAELQSTADYLRRRGDILGVAEARNLSKSAADSSVSEAGLGARNGRGGSVSNAVQPPPGRESSTTGTPPQSQNVLPMQGSIAEAPAIDTPAFKQWFAGSKIVDEKGRPLVMYHGTNATDVKSFSPFTHFGTRSAANERAIMLHEFSQDVVKRDPGAFQIMPVYLKIKKPLRLPDLASINNDGDPLVEGAFDRNGDKQYPRGWEGEEAIATTLLEQGIIDIDEFEEHRSNDDALKLLAEKGYDGIVYKNVVEDAGKDSYIVFDPVQIKSAIGNRGTFDATDANITHGLPLTIKTANPEDLGFTARVDVNNVQPLDAGERELVQGILDELIKDGMPAELVNTTAGYVTYSPQYSHFGAAYWPSIDVIGVRSDVIGAVYDSLRVRQALAHELTHRLDQAGKQSDTVEASRRGDGYLSASSPRLEMTMEQQPSGSYSVKAIGDLAHEVFTASMRDRGLSTYFNYPLSYMIEGSFTPQQGALELLAQVGGLYFRDPAKVRDRLPKWFKLMESIYGKNLADDVAAQSISATRARLRQALQNAPADLSNEGGLDRDATGVGRRAATGSGDVRGPPGEGMGGRTGGDQGDTGGGADDGAGHRSLNYGSTGGQWDINEPGLVDNLIREWQNNKIDLHRVQNEIERVAGTLPDDANPRLAEELFKGRVRTRVVRFHKLAVEPMLKEIAASPSKLTVADVGNYLWARHVPERNAQMDKVNPTYANHDLAGMTDAQAATMLKDFSAAGKLPDLKSVAAKVDAMVASTQAMLVRDKLESQSTIDTWNQTYKNYVPLFRDVEESGAGMGFKVKGPESQRAMGSTKEALAVVAAVIAQHEKAIIRSEKAQVGRLLIKMAEDFPHPDFWRVDTPPTKRVINKTTGLVETIIDPLYKNREDVFVVKDAIGGGKVVERVLAFNPKSARAVRLSKAMQNLDVVQLGAVTRVVGRVTRLMANLATSWNPQFWITNLARDLQTATVNLQATALKGQTPQILANIGNAQAGILDAEFRNGNGRWAQLYREFEAEGGKMGFMSSFEDLIERNKALAAEIKNSQRSNVNPAKWANMAMDVVEKVNSAVENGTRLSIFAQARKAGLSPKMAASIAKNATVNFDRKGNRSAATGAWYMFFNAQFQGTAILMKSIAKSRRVQAFVGAMVAFAAAMELVNRMIGDANQDEDGNNPYELIPEFTKQGAMIFMLPGKSATPNVKANYVSLPLPYGFSIFHNAGRMLMQAALGSSKLVTEKESPLGMGMNFANALLQNFGPLGGSSTPLQYAAPTIAKPFVQAAENKTWFGAPIHPEPQPFGKAKPDSQSYFRSTSDTAKDLSKFLSDASGGDDVRGGALDIHPGNIEHVFSTITGGTGKFGLGMFDFTKHAIGRVTGAEAADDMAWKNVPFVGKFYGDVDERDVAGKYYRLQKEAQKTFKQYQEYVKLGERDKADALETEHPELIDMGREMAKRTHQRDMKAVREDFKAVDELPKSDRAKARRELRRDEAGIMGTALSAYNTAVKDKREHP